MKRYQAFLVFMALGLLLYGLVSILSWLFPAQSDYGIEQMDASSLKLVWEASVAGENIGSRIIIDESGHYAYVMTHSALTSFETTTGEAVWVNEASGGYQAQDRTLQLQDNILLAIGNDKPMVRALSSQTGDVLWERDYYKNQDGSINSNIFSILSDSTQVYVATRRRSRGTDVEILDLMTGRPKWAISNQFFRSAGPSSFLLTQNRIYVETNMLYGLDKLTGHVLEIYPVLFNNTPNGIIEDGVAYYVNEGVAQAAELSPNGNSSEWDVKWRTNPKNHHQGVSTLFSNGGIQDDFFYISASCNSLFRWCDSLMRLSREKGRILWSAEMTGTPATMDLEGDDLFVLTRSASLVHIDVKNGNTFNSIQFSPREKASLGRQVVAYKKGWLIVSNGNNQLFGFQKIK